VGQRENRAAPGDPLAQRDDDADDRPEGGVQPQPIVRGRAASSASDRRFRRARADEREGDDRNRERRVDPEQIPGQLEGARRRRRPERLLREIGCPVHQCEVGPVERDQQQRGERDDGDQEHPFAPRLWPDQPHDGHGQQRSHDGRGEIDDLDEALEKDEQEEHERRAPAKARPRREVDDERHIEDDGELRGRRAEVPEEPAAGEQRGARDEAGGGGAGPPRATACTSVAASTAEPRKSRFRARVGLPVEANTGPK
jgi:hypothetical protein